MKFSDLGLSEKTIQVIDELGINDPTTVQKNVIPSILEGKDIFTIAPQGCGKTVSYIFPLINIIAKKNGQNILIITPDSEQAAIVSDYLAVFNKYHEAVEAESKEGGEDINNEANVIIGSPDLLLDLTKDNRIDLSKTNILVVDDIHLIKKNGQMKNLDKVLSMLPTNKQNIVYTNRRARDTQAILDKILKSAPTEIKIDKTKEQEAGNKTSNRNSYKPVATQKDEEAFKLIDKYKSFEGKTPDFLINKGIVVAEN